LLFISTVSSSFVSLIAVFSFVACSFFLHFCVIHQHPRVEFYFSRTDFVSQKTATRLALQQMDDASRHESPKTFLALEQMDNILEQLENFVTMNFIEQVAGLEHVGCHDLLHALVQEKMSRFVSKDWMSG
jgi:hypothetical protein